MMCRVFRFITFLCLLLLVLALPASALIWTPPTPTPSPSVTETTLPESSVSPSPPALTPSPSLTPSPDVTPSPSANLTPTPEAGSSTSPTPTPDNSNEAVNSLPYIGYTSINWYESVDAFDLRLINFDGSMPLGLEISYDEETSWFRWTGTILVNDPYLRISFTPTPGTLYYFRLVYPDGTYSVSKDCRIKDSYIDSVSRPNVGDIDGSDREPQPQPPASSPSSSFSSPAPSPIASPFAEQVALLRPCIENITRLLKAHAWLPPFYQAAVSIAPTDSSLDVPKSAVFTATEDVLSSDTVLDVPITTTAVSPIPSGAATSTVLPNSPPPTPAHSPLPVASASPTPAPSPTASPVSSNTPPVSLSVNRTPVRAISPEEVSSLQPSIVSAQATHKAPTFYAPVLVLSALFLLALSISYLLWFKKR